jgi:hypothetical protein
MSQHGAEAEDYVESVFKRSLFADFVVRSPKFDKPDGSSMEAADLLLPFRDTLIAIQVRARQVTVEADDKGISDIEVARLNRKIEKAVDQVKTVKRSIDAGLMSTVTNLRGIQIPFLGRGFTRLVGIVVVDIVYKGGASRECQLELAAQVSQVREIPVHVFLRRDLDTILGELDTIPDLLHYLDIREKLLRAGVVLPLTAELDFLAMVATRYDIIKKCLTGEVGMLVIEDGIWKRMQAEHRERFAERERSRELGRIVDRVIARVHECIGYGASDHLGDVGADFSAGPGTVDGYLAIAEHLAALSRVDRIELGKIMLEKAIKADNDPKGFSFKIMTAPNADAVPVLFMSARMPREIRRRRLYQVACVAYVYLGLRKLLAIVSDHYSATEHCQDFLYLENAIFDNASELRELGPSFFGAAVPFRRDQWGNDIPPDPS